MTMFEWEGLHKQNEDFDVGVQESAVMEWKLNKDPGDKSPGFGPVSDYNLPEVQSPSL